MAISNHEEYRAAVERAATLSNAPQGSPAETEFKTLKTEIRRWDEEHKGDNSHGPEPVEGFIRSDDLPFSGLPGNLGKLRKT
jgi:hypothetical protein